MESKNNTIKYNPLIRLYSRWKTKSGRLMIVHSIMYAFDKGRNKEDNIVTSDLRLLDVHNEKETVLSYKHFWMYVNDGALIPWEE